MNAETLSTRLDGTVMYMSINNPPVNLINGNMVEQVFDLTCNLFRSIKALHKIDLFDDIDVMQTLSLGLHRPGRAICVWCSSSNSGRGWN